MHRRRVRLDGGCAASGHLVANVEAQSITGPEDRNERDDHSSAEVWNEDAMSKPRAVATGDVRAADPRSLPLPVPTKLAHIRITPHKKSPWHISKLLSIINAYSKY